MWHEAYIKYFKLFNRLHLLNLMPDKEYLEKRFYVELGYKLDIEHPVTYNEKIQWLKLYDRRPEYTDLVDKYKAKHIVGSMIGSEFIIPTIGVWENPDEVDIKSLPQKFVIKCNHNSGNGMVVCTDKDRIDVGLMKRDLRKGFKENYYFNHREWPYKNVKRLIIAEKYLEKDSTTNDIRDYKIHCFNGIPIYLQVIGNRDHIKHTGRQRFYTFDWKDAGWEFGDYPSYEQDLEKPSQLDLMYQIAEKLSKGIPYVRIDLYEINGTVFFGEITFHPGAGFYKYNKVYNRDTDLMLGEMIELPIQ